MTWTYNPATILSTPKDQVRLLVGDTVVCDQQVQDEEIAYFLMQRASSYGAAAECCRTLQAKFSRSVDITVGTNKRTFSQLSKQYGIKAAEFEMKAAAMGSGAPYAGGISIADMLTREQNTDRVTPEFLIGMTDDDFLVPLSPADASVR